MTTAPALETVGLTKTYGDAPALEPIDLQVAQGERVVLLGHNGSGKTTLLRMAAGLLEPSAGTATILGSDVGTLDARAATSYLGDQPVFYDDLSVWEHLEYIAKLHTFRESLLKTQRQAAEDFPDSNPAHALQVIMSSYRALESFDHIIAAEEAKLTDEVPHKRPQAPKS